MFCVEVLEAYLNYLCLKKYPRFYHKLQEASLRNTLASIQVEHIQFFYFFHICMFYIAVSVTRKMFVARSILSRCPNSQGNGRYDRNRGVISVFLSCFRPHQELQRLSRLFICRWSFYPHEKFPITSRENCLSLCQKDRGEEYHRVRY